MVVELNRENFDEFIKKNKIAVVDFYAVWCGPCVTLAPIIEQLAEEMPNISFAKVNVDNARELAVTYSIMSIPTLLVFVNGNLVDRIVGAMPKEMLKAKLQGLADANKNA